MDNKTQKEKLEQEMRFLKESFDAEVISKDEYEKGRDRVEKKLKEIQKPEKGQSSEEAEGEAKRQEKAEETKSDVIAETKEAEKVKPNTNQDETKKEEGHFEQTQIIGQKEAKEAAPEKPKSGVEGQKDEKRFFKYAVVFIVLVFVIFFVYSFLKDGASKSQGKTGQLEFITACSSHEECRQEGKEGFCLNPGTKDAKCEFRDIQKINVLVLNDRKNCFNCDTTRVLNILKDWFGAINVEEIDYGTDEGKKLAEKFDARALPMYVMDENITKKPSYLQFKKTFVKKGSSYKLGEDAAGSTFYFKQDNIPSRLDLFVISGDNASIRAENNLKEFLEAFREVKFEKHLPTDKLTEELGIKNFPAFLVNNRVKFSGVHAAETIKDNFCKLNKVPSCEKSLSKSLV